MRSRFGLPCSKLKDYLDGDELPCTTESEAMAIAAGYWIAGGKPEVYMQNSGLGDTVDIVTSLYHTYKIPLPRLVLSMRNQPSHHIHMYKITYDLLKLLEWTNYEIH